MTQSMNTRNCAPSTSSNSAVTMAESCANNRTFSAPVFLKHKISFSVDSLLSSCSSATRLNGGKFSNCTEPSDRDASANRTSQTRHCVQSETEGLMSSDRPLLTSDQSTLTQPLSPVTDTCKSPVDTGPVDDCTGDAATRQCDDNDDRDDDDECNEDLQDEELEVGDEENDVAGRGLYENQLQYFDSRIRDDSTGSRASPSPSVPRDTEDLSPPVIPKPLHHPGLALGHAGAVGPPCWGFPSGLASQFAWMPVYRSVSPSSEYRQT
jgi:hypothetical protein